MQQRALEINGDKLFTTHRPMAGSAKRFSHALVCTCEDIATSSHCPTNQHWLAGQLQGQKPNQTEDVRSRSERPLRLKNILFSKVLKGGQSIGIKLLTFKIATSGKKSNFRLMMYEFI